MLPQPRDVVLRRALGATGRRDLGLRRTALALTGFRFGCRLAAALGGFVGLAALAPLSAPADLPPLSDFASAIDQVSGTLGDANLAAVVENLEADARRLAVLGIGDRQIGQLDRRFLREDAALGLLRSGLVWRLTRLTPATIARPSVGLTDVTSPERPLSRPVRTTTLSPFLILAAITAPPARAR